MSSSRPSRSSIRLCLGLFVAAALPIACASPGGGQGSSTPTPSPGTAEPGASDAWKPAEGTLLTRWAKDVDPDHVLPEYPRPQMVRERWQNLNGLWELAFVTDPAAPVPLGQPLPERVLVPFAIESALSGVMKHADRVVYRRTFTPPKMTNGERLLLHFGAVDWRAQVYVNGEPVADHTGGYDSFSVDITDALREGGPQELVVAVFDPTDNGGQPRGKQQTKAHGMFYTPVTGIWQTVWLEPVPASSVERLRMTPDVTGGALRLSVAVRGARPGQSIEAVALAHGKEVGRAELTPGIEGRVPVPNPQLWGPGNPFLYDLRVVLREGEREVDVVDSYFGMRTIELGKDERGFTRIMLNGKPWFHVGPLDQGWWPDGLYTAPTDEALRYDLEATAALGFNFTRKHIKIEPDRWYYHADKLGLPVWQDMPSGNNDTPEARKHFESELHAMLEDLHNHPSVIVWVPFNEKWGQWSLEDTRRIAGEIERVDPSRLVDDGSGWLHAGAGHMIDVHRYPYPQALPPSPERATVVGEYGGLGWPIRGHLWNPEAANWGYGNAIQSQAELRDRYDTFMKRMWRLRDTHGMSAGVYTQLTDVEGEVNGLHTYDREVLKFDPKRLAAVNRGLAPMILPEHPELTTALQVSITQGTPTEIRYTVDGSEPTATSTIYEKPFTIRGDTVVRARSFVDGKPTDAPEARVDYRKVRGREPVAVTDVQPGIAYAYWSDDMPEPPIRLDWVVRRMLNRFESLPEDPQPNAVGVLKNFDLSPREKDEHFGFAYTGYIKIPREGLYTFSALSDDGFVLWLGEDRLMGTIAVSVGTQEDETSIALRAGLHPFTVHYYNAYEAMELQLFIEGPGLRRQPIPSKMLFHDTASR